jgi:hypothetical protein
MGSRRLNENTVQTAQAYKQNDVQADKQSIWQRIDSCAVYGINYPALKASWDSAKKLFDYKSVDFTLKEALPHANLCFAMGTFLLAGLLIFVLAAISMVESIHIANFASETLSDITTTQQPKLSFDIVPVVMVYQFLLYVVIGTVINLLLDGIAYGSIRVTGGKGTLHQQLHLSSLVWLSVAMSTVVSLIAPLPCLGFVAFISMIFITIIYLMVYITGKAYSIAHQIPVWHGLIIAGVLIIPRLLLWIFTMDYLAKLFNITKLMQGV